MRPNESTLAASRWILKIPDVSDFGVWVWFFATKWFLLLWGRLILWPSDMEPTWIPWQKRWQHRNQDLELSNERRTLFETFVSAGFAWSIRKKRRVTPGNTGKGQTPLLEPQIVWKSDADGGRWGIPRMFGMFWEKWVQWQSCFLCLCVSSVVGFLTWKTRSSGYVQEFVR